MVAAWFFPTSPQRVNGRTRTVLILTGVVGSLLTVLVLYLTVNPIGSSTITAIQGRYFTPIVPVIFLGLVPGRKLISRLAGWIVPLIIGITSVGALAVYGLGIYLSYYVTCGTSIYTSGLCYQPLYKNWESDPQLTQPVTKDVVLQQDFISVCTPIRSIRIWSASPSPSAAGETQITLKDASSGAVLVEKLVNNQDVADYAWVEVPFPPIDDAKGKQYQLEMTSGLSDPAAGISFGVTARREYRFGLIINDTPAENDLMFQYGCGRLTISELLNKNKR